MTPYPLTSMVTDHALKAMIAKYDDHPSTKAIKNHWPSGMTFTFSYVTVNELYNILFKLDAKKATGFDEILSNFLRIGAAPLAVPIALIVNLSIRQCVFPSVYFVFRHAFFSKFLPGFRHKYSCQTTRIRIIEEWKGVIGNHHVVGTVAIDLSIAFDSLPHGLLLAKLSAYGLDINTCRLMARLLYNQNQRVNIGPHKSEWSEIKRGVPQESTKCLHQWYFLSKTWKQHI